MEVIIQQYPHWMRYEATDQPVSTTEEFGELMPDARRATEDKVTYAFFGHWTSNSGTLHLSFRIHNHTSVVLEGQVVSDAACHLRTQCRTSK